MNRKNIIKKINNALEEMPIDDLRDNSEIIIKHPYMRMVIAKDTSVIFHFDNGRTDINGKYKK
tara:strand:- start:198 stop:386 length:189 start_codon:yes stop_codon:yes gene_type:complete